MADARRTPGVEDVIDELEVRVLGNDRRKDAESARRLSSAWSGTPSSPACTSTGPPSTAYQSDAAFDRIATLNGITGVTNESKVIERKRP